MSNSQEEKKKRWNLVKVKRTKKATLFKGFCDFLIGLHNCPTSASVERIFSNYGLCVKQDEKLFESTKSRKFSQNI